MRPALPTFAGLALALAACGTDEPTSTPDEFDEAVDAHWVDAAARGVTVAVVHRGTTRVLARGQADEERALAPHDRLRVGSITKTFTAAVILQLADEGALALDDTIDRWVPGFALGPEVTIRRALAHMTGLYNFTDDAGFLNRVAVPIAPGDLVAWALEHPARFAPGASYGYSNTNYVLLGMVVEAVTGRPYAGVVRARLLDPLGLADTFIEGPDPAPALVPGFILRAAAPAFDASWSFATGSLVSTGADLCRWADALYRGSVLPAPMVELMTTESHPPDGTDTDYGMATFLRTRAGRRVVGHTGSTMGFNAELFIEPTGGDCVAVLANDFFGEPARVAVPLWELLAAK
ncbi:MAG: beta-lactamase family protein [Deltaproteobacteria bacterium]|nr:beta-lactamase family protein [Deltaproteobacteria bacterium]